MTWYPWRFLTSKKTHRSQRSPQAPKINDPFCVLWPFLVWWVGWKRDQPSIVEIVTLSDGDQGDQASSLCLKITGSRCFLLRHFEGFLFKNSSMRSPQAYNFNVYKSSAFFLVVSLKSAVLNQIKFLKKKTPNKTSPRPIHLCFFLFWGGKGWLVFFSEKSWKKPRSELPFFPDFWDVFKSWNSVHSSKSLGFQPQRAQPGEP